jgi:hypothetical protein
MEIQIPIVAHETDRDAELIFYMFAFQKIAKTNTVYMNS